MDPVGAKQVPLTIGVCFLSVRPPSIVAGLIYSGTCFAPTTAASVASAASAAPSASTNVSHRHALNSMDASLGHNILCPNDASTASQRDTHRRQCLHDDDFVVALTGGRATGMAAGFTLSITT